MSEQTSYYNCGGLSAFIEKLEERKEKIKSLRDGALLDGVSKEQAIENFVNEINNLLNKKEFVDVPVLVKDRCIRDFEGELKGIIVQDKITCNSGDIRIDNFGGIATILRSVDNADFKKKSEEYIELLIDKYAQNDEDKKKCIEDAVKGLKTENSSKKVNPPEQVLPSTARSSITATTTSTGSADSTDSTDDFRNRLEFADEIRKNHKNEGTPPKPVGYIPTGSYVTSSKRVIGGKRRRKTVKKMSKRKLKKWCKSKKNRRSKKGRKMCKKLSRKSGN